MNVEQLFDVDKVPSDLKALLIRPYRNDKAKSIVSKLTPDVAGEYSRWKDALLHEFKLSPNTYLERFNSCRKSGAKTFVAFASRLNRLKDFLVDMSQTLRSCVSCWFVTVLRVRCLIAVCSTCCRSRAVRERAGCRWKN